MVVRTVDIGVPEAGFQFQGAGEFGNRLLGLAARHIGSAAVIEGVGIVRFVRGKGAIEVMHACTAFTEREKIPGSLRRAGAPDGVPAARAKEINAAARNVSVIE